MTKHAAVQKIEKQFLKEKVTAYRVGDTIRVHTRIVEKTEEGKVKERTQMFTGTVISKAGEGVSETVSLHRVAYGEGMERVFKVHSPRIAKIELLKRGEVRRSKLYYLRGTHGKKAKVQGEVVAASEQEISAE